MSSTVRLGNTPGAFTRLSRCPSLPTLLLFLFCGAGVTESRKECVWSDPLTHGVVCSSFSLFVTSCFQEGIVCWAWGRGGGAGGGVGVWLVLRSTAVFKKEKTNCWLYCCFIRAVSKENVRVHCCLKKGNVFYNIGDVTVP